MIDTNTEKKTFKLERKQAFLLWEGITENDFLESKFYQKFSFCFVYEKIDRNILASIKHGKRLQVDHCTTEIFIIQNVLPKEIVDNEIINLYGFHRKPNKLPKKLIHEHFVNKEKKSNQKVIQLHFSEDQNNLMNEIINSLKLSLEKEKAECNRLRELLKFYENDDKIIIERTNSENIGNVENNENNPENQMEDSNIDQGDSRENAMDISRLETSVFVSDSGMNISTAKHLKSFVNHVSKGLINKNMNIFKQIDGFDIPEISPNLIKKKNNNK